jgi:AcrR family transcriptional regulator
LPKQVDHDARREELAAALWRLVRREGVEAASIRRVAAEAGWSSGSLRHYFTTQSELLRFAMERVARRVRERLDALPPPASPREAAEAMLLQFVPMDDERHVEMQVWIAFTTRAFVDPGLRPLRDESHAALRGLCVGLAGALGARDAQLEGERLHALVDGLALHGVLDPETTSPDRIRAVLAAQLDALVS